MIVIQRFIFIVCCLMSFAACAEHSDNHYSSTLTNPNLFFKNPPHISWIKHHQLTAKAYDALDFIAASSRQGLSPEKYRYSLLMQLMRLQNEQQTRLFELLLTDSLLKLIEDLATGQFKVRIADPDWAIPLRQFDAFNFLQNAIYQKHFKSALDSLIPNTPEHHVLEQALAQYQQFERWGGWTEIPAIPLLHPGEKHHAIPIIRKRLQFETPDLIAPAGEKATFYDADLEFVVKKFQKKYGLKPDGIIGPETRRAMNISAHDRVKQIKITLERHRWLPPIKAKRFIFINLANYTLTAIEKGKTVLSMRIIIGKKSRQTPSFTASVHHVVFNPYWFVPNKLARLDLLPKQQQDINYFPQHNIRIFKLQEGKKFEVSPYSIDWQTLNPHHFPYLLRQDPGENNALGKVKFLFTNPWGIYMHDTPHRNLFAEPVRAFSSGCIRLEKPFKLVQFSLPDLPEKTLHQYIDTGENKGLKLKQTIPVYAVYFTVWVAQNEIQFSPDIYQRDKRMTDWL